MWNMETIRTQHSDSFLIKTSSHWGTRDWISSLFLRVEKGIDLHIKHINTIVHPSLPTNCDNVISFSKTMHSHGRHTEIHAVCGQQQSWWQNIQKPHCCTVMVVLKISIISIPWSMPICVSGGLPAETVCHLFRHAPLKSLLLSGKVDHRNSWGDWSP